MKASIIIGLILLLLIPQFFIKDLIKDRQFRFNEINSEIQKEWGREVYISSPFFIVPYKTAYGMEGNIQLFPETANIHGEVNSETRYRSIYKAIVYNSDVNISGTFNLKEIEKLHNVTDEILWDKAVVNLA